MMRDASGRVKELSTACRLPGAAAPRSSARTRGSPSSSPSPGSTSPRSTRSRNGQPSGRGPLRHRYHRIDVEHVDVELLIVGRSFPLLTSEEGDLRDVLDAEPLTAPRAHHPSGAQKTGSVDHVRGRSEHPLLAAETVEGGHEIGLFVCRACAHRRPLSRRSASAAIEQSARTSRNTTWPTVTPSRNQAHQVTASPPVARRASGRGRRERRGEPRELLSEAVGHPRPAVDGTAQPLARLESDRAPYRPARERRPQSHSHRRSPGSYAPRATPVRPDRPSRLPLRLPQPGEQVSPHLDSRLELMALPQPIVQADGSPDGQGTGEEDDGAAEHQNSTVTAARSRRSAQPRQTRSEPYVTSGRSCLQSAQGRSAASRRISASASTRRDGGRPDTAAGSRGTLTVNCGSRSASSSPAASP